jgi:zinc and cadmium transporter
MLIYIVLSTLTVSLLSLVGGLFLIKKELLTGKIITYLVSFAAGVLLATSFFDLMPEALESCGHSPNMFFPVLVGIVFFFFLERFLLWYHHHDQHHGLKPSSILVLMGDAFHNFIDGAVIAGAFVTNPYLGITTSFAIAAHEIPHEFADYSILIHSGMKKGKALFYNFISALTAVLGGIIGYLFLNHVENLLPLFLSFSAGMFIYIACSDLIPDMHKDFAKQKGWKQSIPFVLGIFIIYLSITIFHHQH